MMNNDQQKQLIELATRLDDEVAEAHVMSTLAQLSAYVKSHFHKEEALMANSTYSGTKAYLRLQQEFQKILVLFHVFKNLRSHLMLSLAMADAGIPKDAEFYPGMRYRYLRSAYLGGNFSVNERLAIATHHYKSVSNFFKGDFLPTLHSRGRLMWMKTSGDHNFRITLRFPYVYNFDGELCLAFSVDQEDIYSVTFTIAPGSVVKSNDSHVLLISGIQGLNGKIEIIRIVTEACSNVSPAHLLMVAAEAFALSIGIRTIVGIGNSGGSGLAFNYDKFWRQMIGQEMPADLYYMPLPYMGKPIESVAAKHRNQARKRRELRNIVKSEIMEQSIANLDGLCLSDCCMPNFVLISDVEESSAHAAMQTMSTPYPIHGIRQ